MLGVGVNYSKDDNFLISPNGEYLKSDEKKKHL
jgi:hypothetical protein